jgi:hypothetical protein
LVVYGLATCLLLLASGLPLVSHAHAATTSGTGLLIPLYVYPGSAWTAVIQERSAHPSVPITVIINPDDGPGTKQSSTYVTWIAKLHAAGIVVLGYVYTAYATRSLSSAEADIATYRQMYSLNGLFLDQMSSKPGYESYYSALTAYAHARGLALVVGNPGTRVPSAYLGTVDVLLVFENPYLPSLSRLESIDMGQPRTDFALMSYDIPSLTMAAVSQMADFASYIYITSGTEPSPYTTISPYLDHLVRDVQSLPVLPPVPPIYSITVQSVTSSGGSLPGMRTIVNYYGSELTAGFTSMSYSGPGGNPYQVCVENYGNYVFSHWDDGLTNPCRTFGLGKNLVLTATYKVVA